MKVIGISGSPRTDGNTVMAIRLALEEIERAGIETESLSLAGRTIGPCTACMGCRGEPACTIEDDFDPVFRKMLEAEGVIVGSPVYFGSATPETMALLDRAGYVSRNNGNLLRRKVGGPIAVARRAGQNFTYAQLALWYTINEMIVVGSTYWNIGFGRNKGEIMEDVEGVETMQRFGQNVAWLLKTMYTEVKAC